MWSVCRCRWRNFYPRPPRGGRLPARCAQPRDARFLSTPSARRATSIQNQDCQKGVFLSTPSARRATAPEHLRRNRRGISIHALREEGDPRRSTYAATGEGFLSTPSARRATAKTERKPSAFVSLYTSLHKLQRGACKTNRKITPLLTQTAGIPVRSVQENHGRFRFALAGIKRSAHYPVQTPGAAQRARP